MSALSGKNRDQADMVLLDDDYFSNGETWAVDLELLSDITQQAGVNLNKSQIPKSILSPSSTHFAILLRFLGYRGKIFIASSTPPEALRIIQETEEFAASQSLSNPSFPIDGYTFKRSHRGIILCANKLKFDYNGKLHWDDKFVEGDIVQSLSILLTGNKDIQSKY